MDCFLAGSWVTFNLAVGCRGRCNKVPVVSGAAPYDIRRFHVAGADVVVYVDIALIMLQAYV